MPHAAVGGEVGDGGTLINGDVNCSGDVDLSDAIYMLNWLFIGTEEPCPIADPPHLTERIAELESDLSASDAALAAAQAEIDRLSAELATAQAALAETEGLLVETQAQLDESRASLATCNGDLAMCSDELAATEGELEITQQELAACTIARATCEEQLAQTDPQLAVCVEELAATQAALQMCQGDLTAHTEALDTCTTDLAACDETLMAAEERIAELEVPGCMDPEADNYDCAANVDNGSCEFLGCTDAEALNFDPLATVDDGSCISDPERLGFSFAGTNSQGFHEYVHDETGIAFVLLPGGNFQMGSAEDEPNRGTDEGPVHSVTLSPFLISKHEITQAQYAAVMTGHPTLSGRPSHFTGDDELPVEWVSWDDLTSGDGFLDRTGLSLPSEAQWEYACRGGTLTPFSFGDDCNALTCDPCETVDAFMWSCANANRTQPVGTKQANPFGLHDMHGNVWEWCEDVWDAEFYGSEAAAGPDPVAVAGSVWRILRGGSWNYPSGRGRSAERGQAAASGRGWNIGVRVVKPIR